MARSPRKDPSISQKNDASCIGNKRGMARRAKRNSNKRDRQRLKKNLDTQLESAKMSEEKFYRTVITVEVLSKGPYEAESLEGVMEDITNGDCSGDWKVTSQEEVSGDRMAELLIAQGSDPSFLLDEDDLSEQLLDELLNGNEQQDDAKSNSGDETVVGT